MNLCLDHNLRRPYNVLKHINRNVYKDLKTSLSLPQLDVACEPSLYEALKAQGLNLVDLKTLTVDGAGEDTPISIRQKARIIMNEKGTQAAASTVTDILILNPTQKQEANLNRPYIFFIAEQSTGAILFAGHIQDPSLKE